MPSPPFRPKPVLAVLGGYAAVVAGIAFWPTPVDRPINGLLRRVLNRLHEFGVPAWFNYSFVEFTANVLLFVPIGFLVAALLGRERAWLAVVVGILTSVAIECVQWMLLPERFPSVGDVVANTVGAGLGAALLAMVITLRTRTQVE